MLALTGCGGHSASFAARADAVCREQNRRIAALPHATTLAQEQDNYDRRVALVRRAVRALTRLDPPHGREASLHGLVAAIDDELAAAEELRVASLSGDIEGEEGATFRVQSAARHALRRARELGLTVCGRPPPGS